jgi:hypothetical protein
MTRNDLIFSAGLALSLGGLAVYIYVTRDSWWALPTWILILGGAVVVTAAMTEEKYGQVSAGRMLKVALYTIGINVAGSLLFAVGSLIMRAMR